MKFPLNLKGFGFGRGARRKDPAEDLEDTDSDKPEGEPGEPAGADQEGAAECSAFSRSAMHR